MRSPFVIPSSGQNGLRRLVSRTSRPATGSTALSVSTGILTRAMAIDVRSAFSQRFELRRPFPVAHRALERDVLQLAVGEDRAQHQAAAAHVAPPDEVDGEQQPLAE